MKSTGLLLAITATWSCSFVRAPHPTGSETAAQRRKWSLIDLDPGFSGEPKESVLAFERLARAKPPLWEVAWDWTNGYWVAWADSEYLLESLIRDNASARKAVLRILPMAADLAEDPQVFETIVSRLKSWMPGKDADEGTFQQYASLARVLTTFGRVGRGRAKALEEVLNMFLPPERDWRRVFGEDGRLSGAMGLLEALLKGPDVTWPEVEEAGRVVEAGWQYLYNDFLENHGAKPGVVRDYVRFVKRARADDPELVVGWAVHEFLAMLDKDAPAWLVQKALSLPVHRKGFQASGFRLAARLAANDPIAFDRSYRRLERDVLSLGAAFEIISLLASLQTPPHPSWVYEEVFHILTLLRSTESVSGLHCLVALMPALETAFRNRPSGAANAVEYLAPIVKKYAAAEIDLFAVPERAWNAEVKPSRFAAGWLALGEMEARAPGSWRVVLEFLERAAPDPGRMKGAADGLHLLGLVSPARPDASAADVAFSLAQKFRKIDEYGFRYGEPEFAKYLQAIARHPGSAAWIREFMEGIADAVPDREAAPKREQEWNRRLLKLLTRMEDRFVAAGCEKELRPWRRKLALHVVREMNELHGYAPEVRFNSVAGMDAAGIYTVISSAEEELFTSTFNGLFDILLRRMAAQDVTPDELMRGLQYGGAHTFIRMCALYGRLGDLLDASTSAGRRLDGERERALLGRMVTGLDAGDEALERAVAAVETLAALGTDRRRGTIRDQLSVELERVRAGGQVRAVKLYSLVEAFARAPSPRSRSWVRQMHERWGVKDSSVVSAADLFSPGAGVNVQRHFFYRDWDGVASFEHFLGQYAGDQRWGIERHQKEGYIVIRSRTTGRRIEMYANLPLMEEDGNTALDLALKGSPPRIIVHRGHSYHVAGTLERVGTSASVVFLGSCGGYSNLADLLQRAGDAAPIATRGVGAMRVNDVLLKLINEEILKSGSLNFETFWMKAETNPVLRRNLHFKRYVPPGSNMGALFIKAWKVVEASKGH